MRPRLLTRIALLEAADPTQAWQRSHGLASLLAAAKSLPERDPFSLPEVSDSGLGSLLKAARARQEKPEV